MSDHRAKKRAPILGDGVYDVLKKTAQIYLPALGTLYFTVAQIWGLPNAEEVVGTITAIDVFLGLALAQSTKIYNKSDAKYDGVIHVDEDEDGFKTASINLTNYENPADVVEQKEALFKVTGSVATPVPPPS